MNSLKHLIIVTFMSLPVCLSANTKETTGDTIRVDFHSNWEILDAIVHLPDWAFSSWEWKKEDRIKWFNDIKDHGYYIDDDPDFFNLLYLENQVIKIGVVDGYWMASSYLTHSMGTAVLTVDVVNDENTIYLFDLRDTAELIMNGDLLIGDVLKHLKFKSDEEKCNSVLDEIGTLYYSCDILPNGDLEVSFADIFTETNHTQCLSGNTLSYVFDNVEQLFYLRKVYWKAKRN